MTIKWRGRTPRATDSYFGGPQWISSTGNTTSGGVLIDPATHTGADAYFAAPAAVLGDLIVAQVFMRTINTEWRVGVTGGQTWIKCATHQGASGSFATFFCQFNGTWSAAPTFLNSGTETVIGQIHVFRRSSPDSRWSLHGSPLLNSGAGSGFTITGVTPTVANTVALACVVSQDDNEYTLTTPGRWSIAGVKNRRSTGGTDAAMSTVYLTQANPQATGNVTLTQATLGADAGITIVLVFAESTDPIVGAVSARPRASRKPIRQFRTSPRTYTDAPSTGLSAATGLATETDTAAALSSVKSKAVGLSTETDSAFALFKGGLVAATGLASEADSASALARIKSKAAGLSTESDTAAAQARRKAKASGLATEADTAASLATRKARLTGLASEADSGSSLSRVKIKPVGLAIEVDTAFALSATDTLQAPVGLAVETDTASALARRKTKGYTPAVETDSALALVRVKARPVGLATETAVATAAGRVKLRIVARSDETSTGQALTRIKARAVTPAIETSTAFAFSHRWARTAGLAIEVDTAYALGGGGVVEPPVSFEWIQRHRRRRRR